MSGDIFAQAMRNSQLPSQQRKDETVTTGETIGNHESVEIYKSGLDEKRARCTDCKTDLEWDDMGRDILQTTECNR